MSRPKFEELFPNVVRRLEALGENPNDYNVIGLLDDIVSSGLPLSRIDDRGWFRMLSRRVREDETDLPCPSWCQYEHGHPFEIEDDEGHQLRPHATCLPAGDLRRKHNFYLSLVQEDQRQKGDDSTARQLPARVNFAVDDDFSSAELRQLAAALLNAADRLDEVSECAQWTEDRL